MNDLENLLNLDGEIFPIIEDFWKSAEYYMENNL